MHMAIDTNCHTSRSHRPLGTTAAMIGKHTSICSSRASPPKRRGTSEGSGRSEEGDGRGGGRRAQEEGPSAQRKDAPRRSHQMRLKRGAALYISCFSSVHSSPSAAQVVGHRRVCTASQLALPAVDGDPFAPLRVLVT